MFLIGGVAGGLLLGFLLVFVLEFLDPTVIRKGELERLVGAQLLGTLPKLHPAASARGVFRNPTLERIRRLAGARQFSMPEEFPESRVLSPAFLERQDDYHDNGFFPVREMVERLRLTGLNALSRYDDADGLLWGVVSAKPGEGKTFLAANLGVVLAGDLKKPVLLLDANLRRPSLSGIWAERNAPGLSEVLRGSAAPEDVIRETGTPSLYLLPAGAPVYDPAVLFQTAGFRGVLEALRRRFGVILMELPDLTGSAEGLVAAPSTDGLLLVARLYATRKKVLEASLDKVEREKIIGFVLNNAEYWIPGWLYRIV